MDDLAFAGYFAMTEESLSPGSQQSRAETVSAWERQEARNSLGAQIRASTNASDNSGAHIF